MFHPGETVSHVFNIPFLTTDVAKVLITYKQKDHIILVKTITSSNLTPVLDELNVPVGSQLTVTLTQEESLKFMEKSVFSVQLNVITTGGARSASNEIEDKTGPQYYKEVISNA